LDVGYGRWASRARLSQQVGKEEGWAQYSYQSSLWVHVDHLVGSAPLAPEGVMSFGHQVPPLGGGLGALQFGKAAGSGETAARATHRRFQ